MPIYKSLILIVLYILNGKYPILKRGLLQRPKWVYRGKPQFSQSEQRLQRCWKRSRKGRRIRIEWQFRWRLNWVTLACARLEFWRIQSELQWWLVDWITSRQWESPWWRGGIGSLKCKTFHWGRRGSCEWFRRRAEGQTAKIGLYEIGKEDDSEVLPNQSTQ